MRLILFFAFGVLWGTCSPFLPWWAGYPLGIAIGFCVAAFRRPITVWLAGSLSCPDPFCLRCRMTFVDMRRMELEILEQGKVLSQERGERTH